MKVRSLTRICLALICSVLPVEAEQLGSTLEKIKSSGSIQIGYRESSIPFSYYDQNQKPVGYAIDICGSIVDEVKEKLKMPALRVDMTPVTPATRIPLIANGTIDLECGSTTNSAARQKQVGFTLTTFIAATRFVSKKSENYKTLESLKDKTVVTTAGTTTITILNELNNNKKLGMRIIAAKDHAEAFLMMETDRASAFFMDDVLLASLAASAKKPDEFTISEETYSVEPYAMVMHRDDKEFKSVADQAIKAIYGSGRINDLYAKWFLKPIPPRGNTLNLPMSDAFERVIKHPIDSADPADY